MKYLKLYYWFLTCLIAIPCLVWTLMGIMNALFDIAIWKITRLFTNKYWYGRIIVINNQNNEYFDLPYVLLEWRERKIKSYIRGYELTLK
jgi:hypothetical protein